MRTSWDVTIWVGEDVNIVHTVTGGTHTITISGDETGRVALQFLDGFDGLVSFRDEISRVVGAWVPPTPEEDGPELFYASCGACMDGTTDHYKNNVDTCPICGKTWPF